MMNKEYAIINGTEVNVTTVMDKTVTYTPSEEEVEAIIDESETLLEKYFDYMHDTEGLHIMFDEDGEFWKAKGWIIKAFQNHPGYNGKYQIILKDAHISRTMDYATIDRFFDWCYDQIKKSAFHMYKGERISDEEYKLKEHELYNLIISEYDPDLAEEYCDEYENIKKFHYTTEMEFMNDTIKVISNMISGKEIFDIINSEIADCINKMSAKRNLKFRTSAGQKISKLISKVGILAGLSKVTDIQEIRFTTQDGNEVVRTKDFGWNAQFAAFADAINPKEMNATGVLSVNPIDFWTMSFGHKWASCHTIDKNNTRGTSHNYSGMYCGGTESYMLDESSMIFYTLPEDYDGDTPELEDKWKRCVFYIGEDKLIQSRVYPDGRDGGDDSIAGFVRGIVQKTISELFDVPNYWTLKRGTEACDEETISYGPHYRDYLQYGDCNVSFMKRIDGYKNHKKIRIGTPHIICPSCGTGHDESSNIFCDSCREDGAHCTCCGDYIEDDDIVWVDDDPYCSDCVIYCECCDSYEPREDAEYVRSYYGGSYVCRECLENDFTYSEYDDEYVHNDDVIETEEGNFYCPDSDGYNTCYECGELHDESEMIYDEITGQSYCRSCYDDLIEERENDGDNE